MFPSLVGKQNRCHRPKSGPGYTTLEHSVTTEGGKWGAPCAIRICDKLTESSKPSCSELKHLPSFIFQTNYIQPSRAFLRPTASSYPPNLNFLFHFSYLPPSGFPPFSFISDSQFISPVAVALICHRSRRRPSLLGSFTLRLSPTTPNISYLPPANSFWKTTADSIPERDL